MDRALLPRVARRRDRHHRPQPTAGAGRGARARPRETPRIGRRARPRPPGTRARPCLPAARRRRVRAAHGARPPRRGDRAGCDRGPGACRARRGAPGAEVTRGRAARDESDRDHPDRRAARGGRCHRRRGPRGRSPFVPAPRHHWQRQDRGLPDRGGRHARRGRRRARAGARDRPHAPAREPGAGTLRRSRRGPAQRPRPARALGRVATHPRARGARGGRGALGRVRSAGQRPAHRRRRGARCRLQAGGRHSLQCARPRRRAGAARRRRRGAGLGDAVGGDASRGARAPAHASRARHAANAPAPPCRRAHRSAFVESAAARRGPPLARGPYGPRVQPRRRAADAGVPQPPRLRDLSPVSRVWRPGELPALQRDAHLASPRRRARLPPLPPSSTAASCLRGLRRAAAPGVRRRHRADRGDAPDLLPGGGRRSDGPGRRAAPRRAAAHPA